MLHELNWGNFGVEVERIKRGNKQTNKKIPWHSEFGLFLTDQCQDNFFFFLPQSAPGSALGTACSLRHFPTQPSFGRFSILTLSFTFVLVFFILRTIATRVIGVTFVILVLRMWITFHVIACMRVSFGASVFMRMPHVNMCSRVGAWGWILFLLSHSSMFRILLPQNHPVLLLYI